MSRHLARRAAALLAFAAIGAVACSSPPDPREERRRRAVEGVGELTVAAVWPWSNHPEILYRQGLDLALEEINRDGGPHGRPLALRFEDDEGSVNRGRLIAQELAGEPDVVAVIGHLQSFVTVPAAAIYDLAGLPLLAPTATSAELTARGYRRIFRTNFTDPLIGHEMAEYAARQGYRRVAIYYIRNSYGRDLANAFEERFAALGHEVTARDSYDGDGDIRDEAVEPVVDRWRQLEPEAIFLAGEVPSAGEMIAHFREGGIELPILGGDALYSPALLEAAGEGAEGVVVAAIFHPDDPRPEVQEFVQRFAERFGRPPDPGSALAYDALRLLDQAMRRAPSPAPADVARALREIDGWRGVTGPLSFDEKGDLEEVHLILVAVRDGSFEFLATQRASGPGERRRDEAR